MMNDAQKTSLFCDLSYQSSSNTRRTPDANPTKNLERKGLTMFAEETTPDVDPDVDPTDSRIRHHRPHPTDPYPQRGRRVGCESSGTESDNATRRDRLHAWLTEAQSQTALSPREYARRAYRAAYGRNPKPEYWP